MQKEFFDILRKRNREGTTIFLSSHVLSEIQRNCTRAAIIRDGRIIAQGSVDDLSKTSAKRRTTCLMNCGFSANAASVFLRKICWPPLNLRKRSMGRLI